MMSKLRSQNTLEMLCVEAPPFVVALVIAEFFFKFESFTREALAFVALWYVLSKLYSTALSLLSNKQNTLAPPS